MPIATVFVWWMLVFSGNSDDADVALQTLVERNTQALGGAAVLDRIEAIEVRSTIVEPKYTDLAVFTTDRLGRMRVDIFNAGERVFAESFDGVMGRQWRPDQGQTLASEGGTQALAHTPQIPGHILQLKDMHPPAQRLDLLGREPFEEGSAYVLKLTLGDGFETFLLVDPDDWLIKARRDVRALHVDLDPERKLIEACMSDFRLVNGVRRPFKIEERNMKTGAILVTVTVQLVENRDMPEASFYTDLTRHVPKLN